MSTRTRVGITSLSILAIGACLLAWFSRGPDRGHYGSSDVSAAADQGALSRTAGLRVFFAHQSVGANIVGGIPGAYDAAGAEAPPLVELTGAPGSPDSASSAELPAGPGGVFAHTQVGVNGDPVGKIEEFDAWVRSGLGERIDVAFLKLCYIDFTADTDVDAVFARYRDTLDALERDHPEVAFPVLTTPLTTEPGLKTKVKALVGGSNTSPADNAVRQRFNELLRTTYGDRVFDLAAFESTAPDGTRIAGDADGADYFALYAGYALDEGHLDQTTSQVAAARLLTFLARLSD